MEPNFVEINGKKYRVVYEEVKEEMKNPFRRVAFGQDYYFINQYGKLETIADTRAYDDNLHYLEDNYCSNKKMMQRRANEEKLLRKMWKFSMEHGGSEIDWENTGTKKYYLCLSFSGKVTWSYDCSYRSCGVIYFASQEAVVEAMEKFREEFEEVYGVSSN